LSQVLSFDESVLAFTEGIEQCDVVTRAVLGGFWAASRRVALVFTGHRMIEIGLNVTGRQAVGRIRSFPWDRVPSLELHGRWLELRSWADTGFRWYLRDELDPSIQQQLRAQADLSVSTYQPSQIRSVPLIHCSHCGVVRTNPDGACTRCQSRVRSPSLAGWLALAFPGAGHFYASRRRVATMRFGIELLIFGSLASAVLVADTVRGAVSAIAIGAFVLILLKFHGGAVARNLSRQGEAITAEAHRRWRRFVPLGLLLSLTALIAPLPFAGMADADISWDLDFLQSSPSWTRIRAGVGSAEDPAGRIPRSRWLHPDGWELRIDASPLRPFESTDTVLDRVAGEIGGVSEVSRIGQHDAMWGQETQISGAGKISVVRLAVIDHEGRDVHVLSMEVASENVEIARRRMEQLVRRAIWVAPSAAR
jgi:hypothetical protein